MNSLSTVHSSTGGQDHDRIDGMGTTGARPQPPGRDAIEVLEITAGQKMVSAMSGSLLTSLLVTPLDVVRVRLQSQQPAASNVDFSKLIRTTNSLTPIQTAELGVTSCCREVFFMGNNAEYCIATPQMEGMSSRASSAAAAAQADCAVQEVQRRTYRSTFDGLRKIAQNEGFTTLWRGLSPTLVMAIPANIIYFTGYEWLRFNQRSPFSRLNDDHAPLVAGSMARVLAATAVGPIELVRTRMQAVSGSSAKNHMLETFKGIKEMVGLHGYGSLWRGLTLTLWRDVPFSGLYWWGYETIRARLTDVREERRGRTMGSSRSERSDARRRSRSRENHTETFVDSFTAGASSGAFASIVTTPFDVGKTRTQVYRDSPGASGAGPQNQGRMFQLLWSIFKTEGAAGLWRGVVPRTLKVAPSCAIMISTYEVGKRVFRGANEKAVNQRLEGSEP
ncbi:hypothetical protein N3K66_005820 [Trichothecium roseum]|uniref:Uncharacterized protein n=1 Tax=Trichothecium roseum TaxID=47278 RepID=A0ACC0V0B6_9HYPO|nr:hypothetical protein N3K66_005820 [Trichothecium roseum]